MVINLFDDFENFETRKYLFENFLKTSQIKIRHPTFSYDFAKQFVNYINEFFVENIQPQLEIVVLDENSKFPNLTDTSSFLTIKIISKSLDHKYALIKIPTELDRFLVLNETKCKYVILLDDIIRFH